LIWKQGASKAVKEYIIVPLFKGGTYTLQKPWSTRLTSRETYSQSGIGDLTCTGPFGNWKPYDDDAKPEITSQPLFKRENTVEEELEEPIEDTSQSYSEKDIARLEAFAGVGQAVHTPPDTPAVSIKAEDESSDSELSTAQSMESIEFDNSFSSAAHSATPAPADGTHPIAGQLSSSPLIPESASPQNSPYKLQSVSPTSSEGSSGPGKSLSKVRKECIHCRTVATSTWMNGPTPQRNRCQNPSCNKIRDRY
jgi:hypothetical protein